MGYTKISAILLFIFSSVSAEGVENSTKPSAAATSARSNGNLVYAELINCAVKYDTGCFVNAAQDYLAVKRDEILAQADRDVLKVTGRSDPENTPSHLVKTIETLFTNLMNLFGEAMVKDEEENKEGVKETSGDAARNEIGESRKLFKKKGPIKKIKGIIKMGLLIVVVFLKVTLLIKLFEAALKFKIFLVGLAGVVIQGLKFWQEIRAKKEDHHHHDDNIIYKNTYEGGDFSNIPGAEYHARSFDGRKGARPAYYGQEMAYSQSKPN